MPAPLGLRVSKLTQPCRAFAPVVAMAGALPSPLVALSCFCIPTPLPVCPSIHSLPIHSLHRQSPPQAVLGAPGSPSLELPGKGTQPLPLTSEAVAQKPNPFVLGGRGGEEPPQCHLPFQSFQWNQAEVGALLEITFSRFLLFPVLTNGPIP